MLIMKFLTFAEYCKRSMVDDSAATVSAQTNIETPGSSISLLTKKRDGSTKIDGISKQAYLIANKYGMSSRCLAEMAAAFHSSQGTSLNQLNLLVYRRRKANTRLTIATHIRKKQLNESNTTLYALHWDGKLIKFLMHTGNDVERVAILLTG